MRRVDRSLLWMNFSNPESSEWRRSVLFLYSNLYLGSFNAAIYRLEKKGCLGRYGELLYLTDKGQEKIVAMKMAADERGKKRASRWYEERRRELEKLKRKGY